MAALSHRDDRHSVLRGLGSFQEAVSLFPSGGSEEAAVLGIDTKSRGTRAGKEPN